ncbi:hypothetical protein [Halomarina rubra]|uniref:Transcriptional regulator n=1 Tax=Halomarina rubra TaxID=2071873 RepID=A0ABD6B227_9EURY|nr:hypothetical protein [Halomarina rubra]
MTEELPEYEKGDILEVRGGVYRVTMVDILARQDKPLQYRLECLEGPPMTLKPEYSEGEFVATEYHGVSPDDITVQEGDDE